MKYVIGFGILFAFMVVSGLITSQDALAYTNPPVKDTKQFMSGVFLVGFIGIYGGTIYLHKTSEMKKVTSIQSLKRN
jgi:hypothetical protein